MLDIDDFTIPAGSILGLSGPNGSGKTTLLKLLAFAMAPSQGEIFFDGKREFPMSARVRSRVTLMTQTPYLLKRSVMDNLAYGLKIRKDTKDLKERATRALTAVGLDFNDFHSRPWHQLSGGEAQRVALAARLILKPRALLLDEPVASVDAESARLIREASLAARDRWGCTLIIVSHDLEWLNACSDTRISMAKGRIFSTLEEIMFPGPYQTINTEKSVSWRVPLSGNLEIRLPEKTGETALIEKDKIKIDDKLEPEDSHESNQENRLSAQITRMALEPQTDRIEITFAVDNFRIPLFLQKDQAAGLNLQPGKKK